jgi:hypothetical protein
MPSNSETILTSNIHPSDSSVQIITGDKYKGDGYYGRSDGIHTVQYDITGFIGTISIQATLAVDPTQDDWFTVYTQSYPVSNDEGTSLTKITNFTGNYVWIRAYVEYTDGSINSIKLNH